MQFFAFDCSPPQATCCAASAVSGGRIMRRRMSLSAHIKCICTLLHACENPFYGSHWLIHKQFVDFSFSFTYSPSQHKKFVMKLWLRCVYNKCFTKLCQHKCFSSLGRGIAHVERRSFRMKLMFYHRLKDERHPKPETGEFMARKKIVFD